MKRASVITVGLLVIGLTVLGCAYVSFGQSDGWVTLIDGAKGLDNWNRVGDANWRAEDGAIVADKGKGGFLVSKNSYKDFQIRAEFWADHTTNSGVFIRITDPNKITATDAYEVNIYDHRPDPSYGTGAIVNFAKVEPMPKAGGKWNTYDHGEGVAAHRRAERRPDRQCSEQPAHAGTVRASVRPWPERRARWRHQVAQGADQVAVVRASGRGRVRAFPGRSRLF
jgi:hypothetical protein